MNIKEVIKAMTLEEKASLCSGLDFWHTKPVPRLGVPSVMVSDGPHGLRKQAEGGDHLGINESIKAVCFPAGCASTASFDRDLIHEMGDIIGNECQAENLSVVLGPAVNIKRSPLCGRNFEYMSEDPYLAGEMAASYICGVQKHHVGTSIKHFALNNQEHERMSISSEVDERTMREIYLPAFETAVKKAQPKTVMNSYNRINGTFAAENHWLLTEVLRDEWGFEGYVMTDWGANNHRVAGLKAGQDLEMPGGNTCNDGLIVDAVRNGTLDEAVLDKAVERILTVIDDYENHREEAVFDRDADHEKSVQIAEQCMVLLKNEDSVLPLDKKDTDVLFVGGFAQKPRIQGGGSSHINCYRIDNVLDEVAAFTTVSYEEGFAADRDVLDETLQSAAVNAAKSASKVVIFAGLPDSFESEGYDRTHMQLPACQNALIAKIAEVNDQVIVVLHNGSPVEMPWIDNVQAVLEAYLGGEGTGKALARLLYGDANPSGKLAETFPLKLEDNPSYLNFPGKHGKVCYQEGIFVGYRYYDTKKMDVLFPFGHGLSYTTFALSNLRVSKTDFTDQEMVTVSIDVTNTGKCFGREVVQLYVSDRTDAEIRPAKELKGFEKVALDPGETKTVAMNLDKRSFACYSEQLHDWYAASGEYVLMVGTSSRNIAYTETVHLTSSTTIPFVVHRNTTFGQLADYPKATELVQEVLAPIMASLQASSSEEDQEGTSTKEAITDEMSNAMMKYMPIRAMRSFGSLTEVDVQNIVAGVNEKLAEEE